MELFIGVAIAIIVAMLTEDLADNMWRTKNLNQADEYWIAAAFGLACVCGLAILLAI